MFMLALLRKLDTLTQLAFEAERRANLVDAHQRRVANVGQDVRQDLWFRRTVCGREKSMTIMAAKNQCKERDFFLLFIIFIIYFFKQWFLRFDLSARLCFIASSRQP